MTATAGDAGRPTTGQLHLEPDSATNTPNPIAALYPGTKFIAALALGISAFLLPGYWPAFAIFGAVVLLAFLAGEGWLFLKTVRNSLLILVIFMLVIRTLFTGSGGTVLWELGPFAVTTGGLASGLGMVSRVLALGSALLLFFRLTPVKDITSALENAGMPPSATYVVLSAIQMIPQMRKQSGVIMDAQKTRGVETEGSMLTRARAFVPTLGPLVLSSIAATEERVITLESRAFTAAGPKTRLYRAVKRPVDRVVLIVFAVLFALALIGRILLWVL